MLDLGTSFVASAARDPDALAIVDGALRLTYAQWYRRISAAVAGLDELGLESGDHLITVLQNRWEAATIHWACQFAGLIITPLNWRATADDLDFCIADSDAKALVYETVAAEAVRTSKQARARRRIAVGYDGINDIGFESVMATAAKEAQPRASADSWSVMLYTSGTTAKPKGVPRRQRAEHAALSHHGCAFAPRNVLGERGIRLPAAVRCRGRT
jgi:2-furoate---CoA ligase